MDDEEICPPDVPEEACRDLRDAAELTMVMAEMDCTVEEMEEAIGLLFDVLTGDSQGFVYRCKSGAVISVEPSEDGIIIEAEPPED